MTDGRPDERRPDGTFKTSPRPFAEALEGYDDGLPAEDVVAVLAPLFQQVATIHAAGRVAPLEGLDALFLAPGDRLFFENARSIEPREAWDGVRRIEGHLGGAFDVLGEQREIEYLDGGRTEVVALDVARPNEELKRPVYLTGYRAWEHHLGHHDAASDVFILGLILASVACGLDLRDRPSLERFAASRDNLFNLNENLDPVLARLIVKTTELDRHRRIQDSALLAERLVRYREVEIDVEIDVTQIAGFTKRDRRGKRAAVLTKLEERLFDISRRNPLLHFKPRANMVNLTLGSVPLRSLPENLRPEHLLLWQESVHQQVVEGKRLALGSYLRFSEALYLPGALDKVRLEAARDEREYGFSNLRLVIAFLRWHNLKEQPEERIDSPLLLLPVRLVRKKGVRDQFVLEFPTQSAEVNPVLRHHLRQLYDLRLPDAVDLGETRVEAFYDFLAKQIEASEPGVELRKIDRPQARLIHIEARRRLDRYLRRRRSRRTQSYLDLEYSYRREHFQPLGLQLFLERVRPASIHLDRMAAGIGKAAAPPHDGDKTPAAGESETRERHFVSLEDARTHPYAWQVDLTALTLGNFRYRKMSLVRDYEILLEDDRSNPVFDTLFSVDPRPAAVPAPPLPLAESHPVLPCDPTQASAIAAARQGTSYIIQGPPGTGKSQTIANLIADCIAQGQRVLFVCQKRAAIDVVYLRLKTLGLESLCSLVHDSQGDKKAVIHDLKAAYEKLVSHRGTGAAKKRQQIIAEIEAEIEPLKRFETAMTSPAAGSGEPLRRLLERLVALRESAPELDATERESLPRYALWAEHREQLGELAERINALRPDGVFSRHPLAVLAPRLGRAERPRQALSEGLDRLAQRLAPILRTLEKLPLDESFEPTLAATRTLLDFACRFEFWTRRGLLALAEPQSEASRQLENDLEEHRRLRSQLEERQRSTENWRDKLSATDVEIALPQSVDLENRLLPFLSPTWWRLRRTVAQRYDFKAHAVRPTLRRVLDTLREEYNARNELETWTEGFTRRYEQPEDPEAFASKVQELRRKTETWSELERTFFRALLDDPAAQSHTADLPARMADLEALEETIGELLAEPKSFVLTQLPERKAAIDAASADLDDVLPILAKLAELPEELARAVRERPLSLSALEAAIAEATLEAAYREDRELADFDRHRRHRRLDRLAKLLVRFYAANAANAREEVHQRFAERLAKSAAPAAELTAEEKEWRKLYKRGRRDLEHEFSKKQRYKSIRDLWAGPAGEVMRDLKPVWLMSPLSIADILPLESGVSFDAVIFDEASQIPVEEAVPALFRAGQAVVVGDQMQLPPTRFFAARDEDELLLVEEEGEDDLVEYELSSNSFLNQAGKRMPGMRLGWHYRSRSETLITFSNAAFYGGRLLSVPEEELVQSRGEIRVRSAEDGERGVEGLLERGLSFHFHEEGCYESRRNIAEAEYIAALVDVLLRRGNGLSLGVVAFSEAQQNEIERALDRRAARDPAFRRRLEAEWEREEDGELVGLLVKNLENIQGDERDVVILSVCYGPAADGKMRMSFGPINQAGGEKRLNVAFSRAKHHMVVVSSIHHSQITNLYNDGANALRQYLRYAAASSSGDDTTVEQVLTELGMPRRDDSTETLAADAIIADLTAELTGRGYRVDSEVGHSVFRCNLAVCREEDRIYRAGLLVDTAEHYAAYRGENDILERNLVKPRLLQAFGWEVFTVLTKDWHHDREAVLESLLDVLERPTAGSARAEAF